MSLAGCQVFGRLAKSCLRVFHARTLSRDGKLDDEALAAVKAYCGILRRVPARQVSAAKKECFFLYTDASLEEGETAPVQDWRSACRSYRLALTILFVVLRAGRHDDVGLDLGTKCIFILELLAVCIGFWLWGDVFGGSSLVAFTDNEAAKACLSQEKLCASDCQQASLVKQYSKLREPSLVFESPLSC